MMESRGNIVMLANSGHPPLDTRIFQKEARTLADAGFAITIIVPHTEDFVRDGIRIISVPLYKKGFRKLITNPWNVFRKAFRESRDSYFHIHDSELLLIGLLLKCLGRKMIYDAHEDTPQQISYQHWIPSLLKKPYTWFYQILEKICGWSFDAIIIAEPVIGKYFPQKKTTLIRNFPMVGSFKEFKAPDLLAREKKLVYVGLLSKVRGLMEMVEGVKLALPASQFEFVIGGQFAPPSLEQEIMGYYPVKFLSWVSYDQLIPLLFSSRVGIIIPHPIERYKTNYPVKLFEYMAAGLPVIASSQGEASNFVKEGDCGILVDPLNPHAVALAITELMTNDSKAFEMGQRGQRLVFEKYNWELEGITLVNLYTDLFRTVSKN